MSSSLGLLIIFLQCFLLVYTGASIKKKWLGFFHIIFSLAFTVGVIMKIMHWPFATEILQVGILTVFLISSYDYVNRPQKELKDFLLIIWLSLVTISYLLLHSEIPAEYYLRMLTSIMFWVNITFIVYLKLIKGFTS
jgi:hypothetical protein